MGEPIGDMGRIMPKSLGSIDPKTGVAYISQWHCRRILRSGNSAPCSARPSTRPRLTCRRHRPRAFVRFHRDEPIGVSQGLVKVAEHSPPWTTLVVPQSSSLRRFLRSFSPSYEFRNRAVRLERRDQFGQTIGHCGFPDPFVFAVG
jgi:hypothetical protein